MRSRALPPQATRSRSRMPPRWTPWYEIPARTRAWCRRSVVTARRCAIARNAASRRRSATPRCSRNGRRIRVVADFRSRDVAAGGQGAPLAPAFHAEVFLDRSENRAILNVGGIANLTRLAPDGTVMGFDSGPGNGLMDLWCAQHTGAPFDESGKWASGGRVLPQLLARMQQDPYFALPPPKSTGRDLFNDAWVRAKLNAGEEAQSVQATLLELTARSICDAIGRDLPRTQRVIACGGGTKNLALMRRLRELLDPVPLEASDQHGIDPQLVEAVAFAWLARQSVRGRPGNLPSVTGARGPRMLGAVYPP